MTAGGWLEARRTPAPARPGGRLRALAKGTLIATALLLLLLVHLAAGLAERLFCRGARPFTPGIARAASRFALWVMGVRLTVRGTPLAADGGAGAMVANHSGWMDIFALNAATRLTFVSKAEVARWPGIGLLARAAGTVFITRKGTEARNQQATFERLLTEGRRLLFFPEGTSTDSCRVLPFKSTLFAAFFAPALRGRLAVQPVTLIWHAPPGEDARFYGWWGDMAFGPHLVEVLAAPRQGSVEVVFHPPLQVADFPDRKALARAAEAAVRSAHPGGQT